MVGQDRNEIAAINRAFRLEPQDLNHAKAFASGVHIGVKIIETDRTSWGQLKPFCVSSLKTRSTDAP